VTIYNEPGALVWNDAAVDDPDAAQAKAGGKITMAPQDTEFGRFAVLEDPWGAAFSVMQDPA
jgi:predicted enzyme related to lactoylglutathione lyase